MKSTPLSQRSTKPCRPIDQAFLLFFYPGRPLHKFSIQDPKAVLLQGYFYPGSLPSSLAIFLNFITNIP